MARPPARATRTRRCMSAQRHGCAPRSYLLYRTHAKKTAPQQARCGVSHTALSCAHTSLFAASLALAAVLRHRLVAVVAAVLRHHLGAVVLCVATVPATSLVGSG